MFDLYLFIIAFVVLCLFFYEPTQPAIAYASSSVSFTVVDTYSDEPVQIHFVDDQASSAPALTNVVAESFSTPAVTATVEPEEAIIDTVQAQADSLCSSMTKKDLLALIQSNGWWEPRLTKLNKRQLAEVAAQRQALAH